MNKEDLVKKKEALLHQLYNIEGAIIYVTGLIKEEAKKEALEKAEKEAKKDE